MLDRLEAGFKIQQSFLASAAHELQTPLTLIRGQIESDIGRDGRAQLLQDVDQMSRQVRQLLHLAEVREPQSYKYAPVLVGRVITNVVQFLDRHAASRHVQIVVLADQAEVQLTADESATFMLLKNLVENAIAASPAFSVVTIELQNDAVMISDEGDGIHPSHLPHLFTRFWRAPESTYSGAGLGLSICAEIATAHGWQVSVDQMVPWTRFVVTFAPPVLETFARK